jgi:hypothetical protein
MTIWGEYIVVVRPYDVQLFSRPSSSSPPRLLRAFEFGRFAWEAVIVDSSALKKSLEGLFPRNFSENTDSVISFILTHQHDAFLYVIETDFSLNGQSPHDNLTMRLAKTYGLTHGWMNPSWHLRAGITGKRITWISGGVQLNFDSPILCSSVLTLEGPGICNFDDPGSLFAAEIEISDTEKFPALWAFPQFDFDEALGLLAVGNVFGELAVCDYVGRWSDDLLLLAEDISAADAPSFLRLPDVCILLSNLENNCTDSHSVDRHQCQWIYCPSSTNLQTMVFQIQRHWAMSMRLGMLWPKPALEFLPLGAMIGPIWVLNICCDGKARTVIEHGSSNMPSIFWVDPSPSSIETLEKGI